MVKRKKVTDNQIMPQNTPEKINHPSKKKNDIFENVVSNIIGKYASTLVVLDNRDEDDEFDEHEEMDEETRQEKMVLKKQEIKDLVASLASTDTLKTLLATQMASVHDLQEFYFALTKVRVAQSSLEWQQYTVNTLSKLSNIFIQQATLMHKLQGHGAQQSITVEHVHVHSGGKAVVGHIEANAKGTGDDTDESQN